jgi:hypothetical protein
MLPFDPNRVRENARRATTPDLLDRVTVYREGLEPEALAIIESELRERGLGPMEIQAHRAASKSDPMLDARGVPRSCSFCGAPAVSASWGWHKLWGKLPLFPRRFRYCKEHR